MFTGIVEEVGRITRIAQQGKTGASRFRLEIRRERIADRGRAFSVSGVCLTALDIKPRLFCSGSCTGNMGAHLVLANS